MVTTTQNRASIFLLLVALSLAVFALSGQSFSQGPNNRNVSVDTRVNITQSLPIVVSVDLQNATNITLVAGATKFIYCNGSALDYNGGSTLTANATIYHSSVTGSSASDNNTRYVNTSCVATATSGYYRNFSCGFAVQYYANAGTWTCDFIVEDDYNFTDSGTDTSFIDPLLALNVTTLIDYGNLAVGDTSTPQQANVTNLGNQNINITVKGYGAALNDGLSFVCQVGNIGIKYEKFNVSDGGQNLDWYKNLSSSYQRIPALTIPQQLVDNNATMNSTYWILEVPPNPFGECNGTVVFQAEAS